MARIKYRLILFLGAGGMLVERLWNSFWQSFVLALFFVTLVLIGLPQVIGVNFFILLAVTALLASVIIKKNQFRLPAKHEIKVAVEKNSDLKHNPIETLSDKPIENISANAFQLWRKHLERAEIHIKDLKVYLPRFNAGKQDRFALRYLAVMFLTIGLVVAGTDAGVRIQQGITPNISGLIVAEKSGFDLWLQPPEYTKKPAIFLAAMKQGVNVNQAVIPEGSVLKIRASGYFYAPGISYKGVGYKLKKAAKNSFTLDLLMDTGGVANLELSYLFKKLGKWSVTVYKDAPPELAIVKAEPTVMSGTKITYKLNDDHGVESLTAYIKPSMETLSELGDIQYSFDLPASMSEEEQTCVEDLTSHIWAGKAVEIVFEAIDGIGNKSVSPVVPFVLPQRDFKNYAAQAVIEQRSRLGSLVDDDVRKSIMDELAGIAVKPDLYRGDIRVFMALNSAIKRLVYDFKDDTAESVSDLLWSIALKLEDGGLSLVQKDLNEALQKLSSALNDKSVSDKELAGLVEKAQKIMESYLRSLAVEMRERFSRGENLPVLSPALAQKFTKSIDIRQMLEDMQRLSKANSREDLQRMAESLRAAVNNFDINRFNEIQKKQMQAMKSLQEIEKITKRQQLLLDVTNRLKDKEGARQQAAEQLKIKDDFNSAIENIGGMINPIPDNFARANLYMKGSAVALGEGVIQTAVTKQKDVLAELQKGLDKTAALMAEQIKQSIMSFGFMPGAGNFGKNYDPLGRGIGNENTKIPSEKQQRRVQKIIEELRKRSNSPNKTKVERDYIERLLN